MGYEPRRFEKFESADAAVSQLFPLGEWEQESAQPLRTPLATITGAHFGYDLLGTAPGLMDFASETLRCIIHESTPTLVDTAYDDLMSKLWRIGQGKLFSIDNAAVRRWAYARLRSMPTITWKAGDAFIKGASMDFVRLSPWYGTTQFSQTTAITITPQVVSVTNTGNFPIYNAVLILRGTFVDPTITNTTNGYTFGTTRDGAGATNYLKIDAGRHTVQWSTNSGGTYADDYALYTRPLSQVALMKLEPGANSLSIAGRTGTTNLDVSFYPAFH